MFLQDRGKKSVILNTSLINRKTRLVGKTERRVGNILT